jgi:predicted ferric reductase
MQPPLGFRRSGFPIQPPLAGYLTSIHKYLKTLIMGGLLYIIAVVLIILWAIGYFGYHAGGIIHVLLVIAVIAILLRVIRSAD